MEFDGAGPIGPIFSPRRETLRENAEANSDRVRSDLALEQKLKAQRRRRQPSTAAPSPGREKPGDEL